MVVTTVAASTLALALRRGVLARIAFRNIARRKAYVAIAVAGLMIATAMISASLVIGDTLDSIITKGVFEESGNVDIVISVPDEAGIYTYFNQSVYYSNLVSARIEGLLPDVDAMGPAIRERIAVLNLNTSVPVPRAFLFGFDPLHTVNQLVDESGTIIGAQDVSDGGAVVNRALADQLNASEGDSIILISEFGDPVRKNVTAIAANTDMGKWGGRALVFLDMESAQAMLNRPQLINAIDVSNRGGPEKGYLLDSQVVSALEKSLPSTYGYRYELIKEIGIENARSAASQISSIFLVISSFAIIAGMALMANIFVILAEERRTEMGILRAIGMKRADLTQTFVFEGSVYALIASAAGAFVGLAIAYVMVNLVGPVLMNSRSTFSIHYEWNNLFLAASSGFLITILSIVLASWRVSKLNIVRAIGDIPEPPLSRLTHLHSSFGGIIVIAGFLMTLEGARSGQLAWVMMGPCLCFIGAASMSAIYLGPRTPYTLAGLFSLFWILDPLGLVNLLFGSLSKNVALFTVSGILLVTCGVLVTMFNTGILLNGLVALLGKRKSLIPVLKAAVSHPLNKKVRTGLTVLIFALIMFTIVVMSMISSFERGSVAATTLHYSGGFQIIGYTIKDVPEQNLSVALDKLDEQEPGAIRRIEAARTSLVVVQTQTPPDSFGYQMIGFKKTMLGDNQFALSKRSTRFSSDEEAWSALETANSSFVIVDGTATPYLYGPNYGRFSVEVDQQLTIKVHTGAQKNVTVIGVMKQRLITGIFTSYDLVMEFCPISYTNLFYFATSSSAGVSDSGLANMIEVEFIAYGMRTYAVEDTVSELIEMVSSVLQLSKVYLGIGQVVGIAGMSIVTIRNVAERRQEIGVLRAIGYQRSMILKAFLLETSFISLLGIFLGVVVGIAMSHTLYMWGGYSQSTMFIIPWKDILLVVAGAFAIILVSTLPPSIRASRIPPAEALRRIS